MEERFSPGGMQDTWEMFFIAEALAKLRAAGIPWPIADGEPIKVRGFGHFA